MGAFELAGVPFGPVFQPRAARLFCLESEKADLFNPFTVRRFVMENITIPSEYLINDPREINSLKPDHVPKSPRIIDCDTRSDLIDILNGLWEAASMASGAPGCENLITQMKALITIVSESTEGRRS